MPGKNIGIKSTGNAGALQQLSIEKENPLYLLTSLLCLLLVRFLTKLGFVLPTFFICSFNTINVPGFLQPLPTPLSESTHSQHLLSRSCTASESFPGAALVERAKRSYTSFQGSTCKNHCAKAVRSGELYAHKEVLSNTGKVCAVMD